MQDDYYIDKGEVETSTERLRRIAKLLPAHESSEPHDMKALGRNLWTRTLDVTFSFLRRHVPPIHWLGVVTSALVLYVYARLVALTARLSTSGETNWPDVHAPGVVALWHRDAPSLLVAYTKRRTVAPAVILVAGDPRGDCLALLCRMLGLEVVRTSGRHGDWESLSDLSEHLKQGACVIITADGGGPARVAKVGAIALASVANVPVIPLSADCHPALQESHKWDAARNPLPFSSLHVWLGASQRFQMFVDRQSIELARSWLEETLNQRYV